MAQHWGRRGAHLSENKGVKSECKKFGENLRKMASVSTICDEDCSIQKTAIVYEVVFPCLINYNTGRLGVNGLSF